LHLRTSPEITGWEHKGTQRYAIVYSGKLYPPKMIISLAAGIRRSEFSGVHQSNSYLEKRGFKLIDLWKDDVQAATRATLAAWAGMPRNRK
jgi:5-methylcytosine-specific restriction enzyme A